MTSIFPYPYPVFYKSVLNGAVEVAYMDEGKGDKTILFVHGLGHSSLGWIKNFEYLKQYYRCISIDLPGNGLSKGDSYPYSMHFYAECVHSFIQALALENVVVAGHSMGGQISMTMALLYPGSINSLVLCAPAGFETFNDWEKSLYRNTMYFVDMVSNEENSLRKGIQNSFYIMPDNVGALIDQLVELMKLHDRGQYRTMLDACINSMLDAPVFDRLQEIKIPVLILFGERDNLIPNRFIHPVSTKSIALAAAEKFENARVEIICQCGHFLQWEKPTQVNGFIREFIG